MNRQTIKFTKKGFAQKQSELTLLETKRVAAVKELATARDMGDRSENGAYKAARWKLSGLDRELRHLRGILRKAEVVESEVKDTPQIGNFVVVSVNNVEQKYQLVDKAEANIAEQKLAIQSPMGASIAKLKEGETMNVQIPIGEISVKLVSIIFSE